MESARQQKINSLLQKDLGSIFQLESRNVLGTGAMISVTKVRVTKDLALAHVFLSLFATDDKEALLVQIIRNQKVFRYMLAKKVKNQLRTTPELVFKLDDSLDYAENIDNLLKNS